MMDVAITQRLGAFALDVAFTAPGGVTALFGPSGAGKTSVLRAVAGLSNPEAGHIRIGGEDLSRLPPRRRRIGYVFQDARLFPHMTVAQNLAFGGTYDRARIVDLLGLKTLLARRPSTLSGGEAQRVAIGRALMSAPQLLLLDEPLASLDLARKSEVMPYLERLRDEAGMPILLVSHNMDEVVRLATTLVMIDAGRVVRAGPLMAMLSDPVLIPQIGTSVAGAILPVRIVSFDAADQITLLDADAGPLVVPGQLGEVGQTLRLRVLARDVILSRQAPSELSALNVLPVTITSLTEAGGGFVDVALRAGEDKLLARITVRSARTLGLAPDQKVYAIIKATAVGG